ncbi:MAG: hypothetical protein Q8O47_09480 [Candidatus Bathyarchaeota archaeon]|nr:hypothetical protein [Candidatus Bathyarchaeota archaeon]
MGDQDEEEEVLRARIEKLRAEERAIQATRQSLESQLRRRVWLRMTRKINSIGEAHAE